jgi:hypothetical protein
VELSSGGASRSAALEAGEKTSEDCCESRPVDSGLWTGALGEGLVCGELADCELNWSQVSASIIEYERAPLRGERISFGMLCWVMSVETGLKEMIDRIGYTRSVPPTVVLSMEVLWP